MVEIVLLLLGRHLFVKASANDAGRDAVHTNAVVRQLTGERPGKLRQGAFDNLKGTPRSPATEEIITIAPSRRFFIQGTASRQR